MLESGVIVALLVTTFALGAVVGAWWRARLAFKHWQEDQREEYDHAPCCGFDHDQFRG